MSRQVFCRLLWSAGLALKYCGTSCRQFTPPSALIESITDWKPAFWVAAGRTPRLSLVASPVMLTMITPTRIWLAVTPGTGPVGSVHSAGFGAGLGGVLGTAVDSPGAAASVDAALPVSVSGTNAHASRPSRTRPTMAAGTRWLLGARRAHNRNS